MCMGGGSMPRSTIVVPNYQEADRSLDRQVALMQNRQQTRTAMRQQELNAATEGQQRALTQLYGAQQQRANDTAANAQRIAALVGAPPPEKPATAPVLASKRMGKSRPDGKNGLRINRQLASATAAQGTSLNIGY